MMARFSEDLILKHEAESSESEDSEAQRRTFLFEGRTLVPLSSTNKENWIKKP